MGFYVFKLIIQSAFLLFYYNMDGRFLPRSDQTNLSPHAKTSPKNETSEESRVHTSDVAVVLCFDNLSVLITKQRI